jgi:acetyl CoA:N6-hydroxylysine acetyl transferase
MLNSPPMTDTLPPVASSSPQRRSHPVRPPYPAGMVYQRFIPQLQGMLGLRTLDPEPDLPLLHAWMNNPRVARFWEEDGSLEQHRAFVQKAMASTHTHPLIGCFNDQPFGYFEAYWAAEDRIAPFCDPDDHDRGIHMLIGDEDFRGPHRVSAWLTSLLHYLFLDDMRTGTIVCEPRWDNAKMITYLCQAGFVLRKHFDFPHKRAALLTLSRATFFAGFGG